jgi:hypothetical protein
MNDTPTMSQRADALEEQMSRELDYIVVKSRLYSMAEGDMGPAVNANAIMAKNPNARVLMGDDPRLPAMPEKPTLMDFFKYRFGPAAHLLQSAKHAMNAGLSDKMVLASLLHDISTIGFIRGDHGYWALNSSSLMSMRKLHGPFALIRCCGFIPTTPSVMSIRNHISRPLAPATGPIRMSRKTISECGIINGTCRAV